MVTMEDLYNTIARPSEGVYKDKGSKFIAYAYPFTDESQLKAIVGNLKDMHPKARHHCWAYRLTPDRSVYRVNDDGEPSGSAGRPILNVLLSADITNVLVVVVRYFGGTLLGVPGLINAYKQAASEAIQVAEVVEKTVDLIFEIQFDYLQMNDIMRIIKEENLVVSDQHFDLRCKVCIAIRKGDSDRITNMLKKIDGVALQHLHTI